MSHSNGSKPIDKIPARSLCVDAYVPPNIHFDIFRCHIHRRWISQSPQKRIFHFQIFSVNFFFTQRFVPLSRSLSAHHSSSWSIFRRAYIDMTDIFSLVPLDPFRYISLLAPLCRSFSRLPFVACRSQFWWHSRQRLPCKLRRTLERGGARRKNVHGGNCNICQKQICSTLVLLSMHVLSRKCRIINIHTLRYDGDDFVCLLFEDIQSQYFPSCLHKIFRQFFSLRRTPDYTKRWMRTESKRVEDHTVSKWLGKAGIFEREHSFRCTFLLLLLPLVSRFSFTSFMPFVVANEKRHENRFRWPN